MADNSILGHFFLKFSLLFIYMIINFGAHCYSIGEEAAPNNSFTVSSFTYAKTELKPYDWRYIRGTLLTIFPI